MKVLSLTIHKVQMKVIPLYCQLCKLSKRLDMLDSVGNYSVLRIRWHRLSYFHYTCLKYNSWGAERVLAVSSASHDMFKLQTSLYTGFDKTQAQTIVSVLSTLSNVSLDTIYKEMVTKAQQVIRSLSYHSCRFIR